MGFTGTFRAVYMIRGPRVHKHGHLFRIARKIFQFGTCHLKIIARNIKTIFRECFSSRRLDSGKILKSIIFTGRPRTTHCNIPYYQTRRGPQLFARKQTRKKKEPWNSWYRRLDYCIINSICKMQIGGLFGRHKMQLENMKYIITLT